MEWKALISFLDRRIGPGKSTYLIRKNKCSQEYTLARPLLEGDLQMRFCAVDVDEGDKQDWDLDLGLVEDVGHKGGKVCVVCLA